MALQPKRFRSLLANEMPVSFLRFFEWGWHFHDVQLSLGVDLLPVADMPQFLALFEDVTFLQPGRNVPNSTPGLG